MIKTHKELAGLIKGKKILHLNSGGKDSATTLHWLNEYAEPESILSICFEYFFNTSKDAEYLSYQKKRYPKTEFITAPNPSDLTNMVLNYQSPMKILKDINNFEYIGFEMIDYTMELVVTLGLDYVCAGHSKYESVSRAIAFNKLGLVQDKYMIYPLGLMTKDQVYSVIRGQKIKLHPYYKFVPSSPDYPSYYKMRALILSNPEFKQNIYNAYPLLDLDTYRWENLLNG